MLDGLDAESTHSSDFACQEHLQKRQRRQTRPVDMTGPGPAVAKPSTAAAAPERFGRMRAALREASDDLGAMITWTQAAGSAAATALHAFTEELLARRTCELVLSML